MFTVTERRPISEELAEAADRWLYKHRLDDAVDESWLELVCEDGEEFSADKMMLHLAAPPSEVAPGDSLDVGRAQAVGESYPQPGAPVGEVPRLLALARTFERDKNGWLAVCQLPAPAHELFTVEDPGAVLAVMNATRRTLARGLFGISGDPGTGLLTFTMVEGAMVARASVAADVKEEFACWFDSGPAQELAHPFIGAGNVLGGLGDQSELIVISDKQVIGRCFPEAAPPPPEPPAIGAAGPRWRVDRPGGLGRDALKAIADLRPREVTLTITAGGALVISGGSEDFTLEGPGLESTHPDVPVVLPYMMALAFYDGAVGGAVDVELDENTASGRLHRSDLDLTVEWRS